VNRRTWKNCWRYSFLACDGKLSEEALPSENKTRCPACDAQDIRHSLPRGLLDSVMAIFGRTPRRCRCCERRFYVKALAQPETVTEDSKA
jgi:hypothetical protein